jgi:alpha-tubulin suppressor-like RCC1 family protein
VGQNKLQIIYRSSHCWEKGMNKLKERKSGAHSILKKAKPTQLNFAAKDQE